MCVYSYVCVCNAMMCAHLCVHVEARNVCDAGYLP